MPSRTSRRTFLKLPVNFLLGLPFLLRLAGLMRTIKRLLNRKKLPRFRRQDWIDNAAPVRLVGRSRIEAT